jgi:hypothetical protein
VHDRVEVLLARDRADDEVGDFLLFLDLPGDELFDVRMIEVEDDHLGRPPRRAARLDRAGCAVADLQE